jgi:hypothetical protein
LRNRRLLLSMSNRFLRLTSPHDQTHAPSSERLATSNFRCRSNRQKDPAPNS